jgi:hypothetical protein
MPYDSESMWQLSFPMPEEDAKALSAQGPKAPRKKPVVELNGITYSSDFRATRSSGFWLSCV